MTQQEIIEYKKRCAELLGGKYLRDEKLSFEPKGRWYIKQFPDAKQNYDLKFDSDWNWIMEICISIGMEFVTTNKEQLIQQIYDKLRSMETNS